MAGILLHTKGHANTLSKKCRISHGALKEEVDHLGLSASNSNQIRGHFETRVVQYKSAREVSAYGNFQSVSKWPPYMEF